jgi:hypothetical protein
MACAKSPPALAYSRRRTRAGWIRGRLAGDALDLVTLAAGLRADNPQRRNLGFAMAVVAGVTALDIRCVQALDRERSPVLTRDYSNRGGMPRPPDQMRAGRPAISSPRATCARRRMGTVEG